MRKQFSSVLLAGVMMFAMGVTQAQTATQKIYPVDLALTYDTMRSNVTTSNSFWMNGGGLQLHGDIYRGIGVVFNYTGSSTANINSSGVGLLLQTATFGPRYTWSPMRRKYSLYGQALIGGASGSHSIFPGTTGPAYRANSLAIELGGGVNYFLTRHIGLRAVEADWLRTTLPNAASNTQNNLQLSTGILFRFH